MAMKASPLAAMIVAKHAPPPGEGAEPGPDKKGSVDESKLDVAHEVIAALDSKNPEALVHALSAFHALCEDQKDEGEGGY